MQPRWLGALAALVLTACPRPVVTTVAGSETEQLDQYAAQLEELRTRSDLSCDDFCNLKPKACGISKSVCDIAGQNTSNEDFQKRCGQSQEDCARFNESCASCKK